MIVVSSVVGSRSRDMTELLQQNRSGEFLPSGALLPAPTSGWLGSILTRIFAPRLLAALPRNRSKKQEFGARRIWPRAAVCLPVSLRPTARFLNKGPGTGSEKRRGEKRREEKRREEEKTRTVKSRTSSDPLDPGVPGNLTKSRKKTVDAVRVCSSMHKNPRASGLGLQKTSTNPQSLMKNEKNSQCRLTQSSIVLAAMSCVAGFFLASVVKSTRTTEFGGAH